MSEQKNSLGMNEKTAGWFAYVLSIISAVILLATEKDNKTVRTHAWQSLFLGCAYVAVYIVLLILAGIIGWRLWFLFSILYYLLWISWVVLTIICIVKALNNDMFKLPVIYNKVKDMK